MSLAKPTSQACENNKDPILAVLREVLAESREVLEIGSGTGQHAVHFAAGMPHLTWRTSDLEAAHPGIRMWLEEAALPNAVAPVVLDVEAPPWPLECVDAVFSANTAHIMHWPAVTRMFEGVGRVLARPGVFALYGPFNYGGAFTSDSNAAFDRQLRNRDPGMGIRDFEAVNALADEHGLELLHDHAMPANNRTLVWGKNPQG